jgi:hypothetical protein
VNLADDLHTWTQFALDGCSQQQRTIYQLVHGIDDTGMTEPRTLDTAARILSISRSAARWHLAMAQLAIYRYIAQQLIAQHQAEHAQHEPAPTVSECIENQLSIRQRSKQAYTNIHLGQGSDEFIAASRLGDRNARDARYQQIHQKYAKNADE